MYGKSSANFNESSLIQSADGEENSYKQTDIEKRDETAPRSLVTGMIQTGNDLPLHPTELRRLAAQMLRLADELEGVAQVISSPSPPANGKFELFETARKACADRRNRSKFLNNELFGEPAWDMLLELYIHYLQGKSLSTKSCCIAARVPAATGLRWLSILIEHGLARRQESQIDRRYTMIELTDNGADKMKSIIRLQSSN